MYDSQNAQCSSRSGFYSSRSPAKSESSNSPSLHCFAVLPHSNAVCIHMCDECMKSIDSGVCHRLWSISLVHFVIDRASLFTDHGISGLPIRARYKHFSTICEHTCDNSPTDFISSSLKWWSSMQEVDTLKSCCVVLFATSQYRSTHLFA